jgi:transposase
MAKREFLGGFELLVLLALIRLGDDAYGVPISEAIEESSGRAVALGSVYITLERLEQKGLVSSRLERFRLVRSTAAMVPLSPEGPMAPYSMDLRKRVAKAWDASGDADAVAANYDVSRAWVHRLIQRRRETGSLVPRKQTKFRCRALTARDEERLAALILARPDATLRELRDAVPTTAALSTLWRIIDRLGFTLKKNGTRRRAAPA